jgi:hypothetical protein
MEDPSAFQSIRVVAQSIAPDSVIATLVADSTAISIGTPTTLTGKFSLPDHTPAAGIPVHLQTEVAGGPWTSVQDGTTDSDGSFQATLQLEQSTNVRMISDSTWQRLEGDTAPLTISVSRILTWNLPASMKEGTPYTITGQIQPAEAGVTLSLNNGATAITDPSGRATFTVTNASSGFVPYQLMLTADQKYGATLTNFVTVWVR